MEWVCARGCAELWRSGAVWRAKLGLGVVELCGCNA